jgi:acyl-coenzyme A thioesterase PaaI-like protein
MTTDRSHPGGARLIAVDGGRAAARLDGDPDHARPADAPAIIALAHTAALAAAASALGGDVVSPSIQTTQLSADLFHTDARGPLVAEAELTYRGRSTLVVDVRVRDRDDRLVASLVATQLAPPAVHAQAS